jgi:hypothetical protein
MTEITMDGFQFRLPDEFAEVDADAPALRQFARGGTALAVSSYRRELDPSPVEASERAVGWVQHSWASVAPVEREVVRDEPRILDVILRDGATDPSVGRIVALELGGGSVGLLELTMPAWAEEELGPVVDEIARSMEPTAV